MSKQTVQKVLDLDPSIADLYQAIYLTWLNSYISYNAGAESISQSFQDQFPELTKDTFGKVIAAGCCIHEERNK